MFLESSRYNRVAQVVVKTNRGKMVKAVKLRRLPELDGNPTVIKQGERLDILSQRLYEDPTMFWHIADANAERHANDLVKKPGRTIQVPEQ